MFPATAFERSRRFLLDASGSPAALVHSAFEWPASTAGFNWAIDWVDVYARQHPHKAALVLVQQGGSADRVTYGQLSTWSNQAASHLAQVHAVQKGDVVVVMLGNTVELYVVLLAAIKLGVCLVPCTTLLTEADLADRLARSGAKHVVAANASVQLIERAIQKAHATAISKHIVGAPVAGWNDLDKYKTQPSVLSQRPLTQPSDPLFLYFTSGTTSRPKMVLHTQESYPVGHLSTMYWLGLREDDVHLNISTPGWAKHAWSNFFAPLNAGCTIFVNNQPGGRFDAADMLHQVVKHSVTSMCCAPTVWRLLVQEDLAKHKSGLALRSICSAGEPLNPEIGRQLLAAWGLTIREGYGQTETTCVMGNPPGHAIVEGSFGVPMPGFTMTVDGHKNEQGDIEGELCISLQGRRPVGLMVGYFGDPDKTAKVFDSNVYRTGDVVRLTPEGVYFYVARADDVFKSSGYRISPFELESALMEFAAIAEVAVVPSPDPIKGVIPKAYVTLKGHSDHQAPSDSLVKDVFKHCREKLPQYIRPKRIEFNYALPKTISGKIQRNVLAGIEKDRFANTGYSDTHRRPNEVWESDVPHSKL